MVRPICFMVMPFGTKDSGAAPPAPARIDFDALWDKALAPLVDSLGYRPVRADQDIGASIILDMLERLYWSDLVMADMSIANGNVYYEIGVRHAARSNNCVLISADWARPLFDLGQIRQLRYPMPAGTVDQAQAEAIIAALAPNVLGLAGGTSPVFQTLDGYPGPVRPGRETVIKGFLAELSAFQAEATAVRALPRAERAAAARALAGRYPAAGIQLPNQALEIVLTLRDHASWADALAYIDALPDGIAATAALREQRGLALSKTGNHAEAIAALEALVREQGETPERLGLLGGRFKRMMEAAQDPSDRRTSLARAIDAYQRGMQLDLNEYYCACNLPLLYRERGRRDDEEQARATAVMARFACERSLARNPDDDWARQTLLVLAFHEGNPDRIEELIDRVADQGTAAWKLRSALDDIGRAIRLTGDETLRGKLTALLERLTSLLPQDG